LDAEYINDLRMMLREMGYPVKAVEQILKLYAPDNFDG
jgi:hypothetical protein